MDMDKKTEFTITEKTLLPFSLVWVLGGAVVAGVVYLATDHAVLMAHAKEIALVKQEQKDQDKVINNVDKKLTLIMYRLKIDMPKDE